MFSGSVTDKVGQTSTYHPPCWTDVYSTVVGVLKFSILTCDYGCCFVTAVKDSFAQRSYRKPREVQICEYNDSGAYRCRSAVVLVSAASKFTNGRIICLLSTTHSLNSYSDFSCEFFAPNNKYNLNSETIPRFMLSMIAAGRLRRLQAFSVSLQQ